MNRKWINVHTAVKVMIKDRQSMDYGETGKTNCLTDTPFDGVHICHSNCGQEKGMLRPQLRD